MKNLDNVLGSEDLYNMVTERLDIIDEGATDAMARFDIESELMELILDLYNQPDEDFPYQKMHKFSIVQVLSYLQASHKLYLSKKLPEIEQTMAHIFNKYAQTHQLLTSLTSFFNDYKNRLIAHLRYEEKEFFPFIKKLIEAQKGEMSTDEIKNILSAKSIKDFNENHDSIEDDLQTVSKIIHSYSENTETPLPYRVFLNQVEIFELELRKHAIIEDHVLVPMAQELENFLVNKHLQN